MKYMNVAFGLDKGTRCIPGANAPRPSQCRSRSSPHQARVSGNVSLGYVFLYILLP
jgi:hypothetical protein